MVSLFSDRRTVETGGNIGRAVSYRPLITSDFNHRTREIDIVIKACLLFLLFSCLKNNQPLLSLNQENNA